jgi:hypothetical protein
MPSSFLFDAAILDPDYNNPPNVAEASTPSTNDNSNIQLILGEDYPFLDFRRPGTPGGVGFYKVQAQVPLFDSLSTECALNCRAVTPAGLENNGVDDGPTCLSPNLTLFHDLGDGTALQGFVGKDLRANSAWREGLGHSIQYGMAWQQPVVPGSVDPSRGLFLFVEALGWYHDQATDPTAGLHPWEVLPGLHYRVSNDLWLSGAVILPVGPARATPNLWHITCSLQF